MILAAAIRPGSKNDLGNRAPGIFWLRFAVMAGLFFVLNQQQVSGQNGLGSTRIRQPQTSRPSQQLRPRTSATEKIENSQYFDALYRHAAKKMNARHALPAAGHSNNRYQPSAGSLANTQRYQPQSRPTRFTDP